MPKYESVDYENQGRMLLQIFEQPGDRGVADDKGSDKPDD